MFEVLCWLCVIGSLWFGLVWVGCGLLRLVCACVCFVCVGGCVMELFGVC